MPGESAPSRFPGGVPAGARGADLEFYHIADRYLDDSLRAYPTLATLAGHHKYDSLLEDLTAAGIEEKLDLTKNQAPSQADAEPAENNEEKNSEAHRVREATKRRVTMRA